MSVQDPITELRQLLLTSQLEQLKVSRSLLAAQQAHAEAVEASLRLNRKLLIFIAVVLAIVGGLNLYALWPHDLGVRRAIILEEEIPAVEQEQEILGEGPEARQPLSTRLVVENSYRTRFNFPQSGR